MTMAREVEKLRAELMNAANVDKRTGILSDLFFFELFDFLLLVFLLSFFPLFIRTVDCSSKKLNAVGQYGGAAVSNENEASGHPMGQSAYEDGYGIHQVCDIHDGFSYVVDSCNTLSIVRVTEKHLERVNGSHVKPFSKKIKSYHSLKDDDILRICSKLIENLVIVNILFISYMLHMVTIKDSMQS